MTCPGCKEEYDDFEHELKYNKALGIAVCKKCNERIDNHHKVDGKYKIIKCKECGHIKELLWIPYKKRGRKVGYKNKKTVQRDAAQKHLTKWSGEPKTLKSIIESIHPMAVYIGYDSGNHKLPDPPLQKTLHLIETIKPISSVRQKLMRKAWYEE